eukprot:CAMPEP_0197649562 /NCGR_PEP_ID=MMETSP1338-20131121/28863_1 /TAXON_ID=43686 ORGANISM="Pelagodinium beii, Strain RCC1491" /NCGR_SAMPLE_ID=MMETSP1338 /ASSEMBLY_ACC=CAM_ASM_000754 /LENGTH=95 /DNA_ID=CAMNT_0043223787 /DNA_START=56 /DNA_END=343 /DNA_ORIENTATION=-
MADLEKQYEDAVNMVATGKRTKGEPTNEDKLKFYGFFKQVKEGDNTASEPWAIQWETKAKWQAWSDCKGMSKEDAMKGYIAEYQAQKEKYGIEPP